MSDITGDAFVVYAADDLPKAIEHVGKTSSQEQIGKAIAIADYDTLGEGVVIADGDTEPDTFIGIVKAASAEARVGFAQTRMINDVVDGSNPTLAPYFDGDVNIPKGKALTIERNCISYVFGAEGIKAGDLIKCADNGKFEGLGENDDASIAVGRAYSAPNANGVIRAYIKAI